MDVIIFCGGRGSRMSDETYDKPKPMIDIGDKPILWHIMKMYSNQGHKRFLLTLGYKGSVIQDWFEENIKEEDWNIEFIKTGINSEKGARLKRAEKYILSDNFHVTYGDGVSDININNLNEELYTHNLPDPDILIRTGGTKRLSNFLLWQLAYTEIFFIDKLWPDFNENDFNKVVNEFKKIKRNFGKI